MIVKAFLAGMGLRAMPEIHNQAVHDAMNLRAAFMAGHARIVRLSAAGDRAATSGSERHRGDFLEAQSDVRAALDELARRLD